MHSQIERDYHDAFWGKPLHGDHALFKMLMLEGMQAGLSWVTVLRKMEAFCQAFEDFVPEKVAAYDDQKVEELMQNEGIIRNRLKIKAVINNGKKYFDLVEKHGSLDQFLWGYVNHSPIVNSWQAMEEIPASTPLSQQISKDLKKMGFSFVGPTIIYAFMQAVGMVNDHLTSCPFRFE